MALRRSARGEGEHYIEVRTDAPVKVAVYREGSGYRVQLGVLDEKTGAWENDEQDEVFPTLADVREYASQEGYEPMDVDFEQMTDEEFQQFLDRSRI